MFLWSFLGGSWLNGNPGMMIGRASPRTSTCCFAVVLVFGDPVLQGLLQTVEYPPASTHVITFTEISSNVALTMTMAAATTTTNDERFVPVDAGAAKGTAGCGNRGHARLVANYDERAIDGDDASLGRPSPDGRGARLGMSCHRPRCMSGLPQQEMLVAGTGPVARETCTWGFPRGALGQRNSPLDGGGVVVSKPFRCGCPSDLLGGVYRRARLR